MTDEMDKVEDFEAHETAKTLPLGWQILFWALILFGIVYTALYTPSLGGWSQEREYSESQKH